jgi:predicted MPP superfamily phosphohydrolase
MMLDATCFSPSAYTIAVLTDIHYGEPADLAQRRTDMADILLLRAVHHLNRNIQPTVTVILGDILDDGDAADGSLRRQHIRSILDKLESHLLIIPGNHDGDVELFYQDFPRPQLVENIGGIRFLPFIDEEAPDYNATRSPEDIARIRHVRSYFSGPIVALQHVCLYPPGYADIPYNYTNAETICREMESNRVMLSLSGHYHKGAALIRMNDVCYLNAPGLCEEPFPGTVITVTPGDIQVKYFHNAEGR